MGITAKMLAQIYALKHSHRNYSALEKIGYDKDGNMTFNGTKISGGVSQILASMIEGYIQNSQIESVHASKITGIISLDNIPKAAIERLQPVANQASRFALTTEYVQNGDTVKEMDTGLMFYVIDDTKLNVEAGYEPYTAGAASSVPWSGVTGKPTNFESTASIGSMISGATDKTSAAIADTDLFAVKDNTTGLLQKFSWANLKAGIAAGLGSTVFALLQYKQAQATVQILASAATITPNWDNGQMATLTLATNTTLANPTNLKVGGTMSLRVQQDAIGGKTMAFGTQYKWPSKTPMALSTAANAVDTIQMTCMVSGEILCTMIRDFG